MDSLPSKHNKLDSNGHRMVLQPTNISIDGKWMENNENTVDSTFCWCKAMPRLSVHPSKTMLRGIITMAVYNRAGLNGDGWMDGWQARCTNHNHANPTESESLQFIRHQQRDGVGDLARPLRAAAAVLPSNRFAWTCSPFVSRTNVTGSHTLPAKRIDNYCHHSSRE